MKKIGIKFWVVVFSAFLVACDSNEKSFKGDVGETGSPSGQQQTEFHAPPRNNNDVQLIPSVLKEKNTAVLSGKFAYLTKKDKKLIFNFGSKEKIISENSDSEHYWLKVAGSYVHVFWWNKFDNLALNQVTSKDKGKVLYAKSSQDGGITFGETKVITVGGGVLPNVKFVVDELGHVTVVYLDERYKGFQIFTNSSQDGGKTWKSYDYRLDHESVNLAEATVYNAVSPNLAHVGSNNLVSIWEQIDLAEDNKKILRIYSRVSHDFGKTWEKETIVYETSEYLAVSMTLFDDGKTAYLFIPLKNKGVMAFTKSENGKWTKMDDFAPNSEKAQINNYFKFASDEKFIYLTYIFSEEVIGPKPAWHTELVRIDRVNKNWVPGSFRFDSLGMGVKSKGAYQDIAVLDDGTVVVVWEDYRRILPMIALNYSTDQGSTWQTIPLILSRQDIANTSTFPFIRKVDKNKYLAIFQNFEYPEQIQPKVNSMVITLKSPKSPDFDKTPFILKSMLNEKVLREKLTKRFNLLKSVRLNKNWKEAWKLRDPVYRNMYKKRTWLNTRDRVIYKKLDLDSINIEFPYASTSGKMVYDLDPDFVQAEKKDPRFSDQREKFVIAWGWFIDDWYILSEGYNQYYLP